MSDKNVIAIVSHSRPECLKINLERLLENEGLENYWVYFFLDYGFNPDCLRVIKWFKKHHKHIRCKMQTEMDSKKSPVPAFYNIFDGYREAVKYAAEFVLPLEEDIIPSNDYLKFHEEVYSKFLSKYDRVFCCCHKIRWETESPGDPNIVIADYNLTSPSCVSVENIKKYILPVINDDLFMQNPVEYNTRHFSTLRNPPTRHTHHDGQLERIGESNKLWSLRPDQARSMHIGVGGLYSGGQGPTGSLDEKINWYKERLEYSKELKKHSNSPRDIVVIPKTIEPWDNIELDVDRTKAKSSTWLFDGNNSFKSYVEGNKLAMPEIIIKNSDTVIDVKIPFSLRKEDLGKVYNEAMETAKSDWVLLLDHDIFLVDPNWYRKSVEAVDKIGKQAGWITVGTNAIGNPLQKLHNNPTQDMDWHLKYSQELDKQYRGLVEDVTSAYWPNTPRLLSGLFILTHKQAWEDAGKFPLDMFLGLDNEYHKRLVNKGYKLFMIKDLYLYHRYYRLWK